jgi:hypothetical protein
VFITQTSTGGARKNQRDQNESLSKFQYKGCCNTIDAKSVDEL